MSAFEAGQVTCCVIIINLFQPDTLFISPWKKSFIARLSELAGYLALPELGTAQPQLVIHLYLERAGARTPTFVVQT